MDLSLAEIAKRVGGIVYGDSSIRVTGASGIVQASEHDVTFLASPKYEPYLETTHAAAIIVSTGVSHATKNVIQVTNPYIAFAQILQVLSDENTVHPKGIHPSAVIGENVRLGVGVALDAHVTIADNCEIGDRAVVYAGVYVGRGSRIGADTVMYPNVVLRDGSEVGARCIIHSGAIIGSDGFGFVPGAGRQQKIPQVGSVVVGDDVEIGANTAIDRATAGFTSIGRGTKIDNLVQIGHNVVIGEHCVVSGKTGIAGSSIIGDHVTIAARAGIGGHLEIGDNVVVGAFAGVTKSVKAGMIVSGFPAQEHSKEKRYQGSLRNVPELLRRVKELELRVKELENGGHGETENHS